MMIPVLSHTHHDFVESELSLICQGLALAWTVCAEVQVKRVVAWVNSDQPLFPSVGTPFHSVEKHQSTSIAPSCNLKLTLLPR